MPISATKIKFPRKRKKYEESDESDLDDIFEKISFAGQPGDIEGTRQAKITSCTLFLHGGLNTHEYKAILHLLFKLNSVKVYMVIN